MVRQHIAQLGLDYRTIDLAVREVVSPATGGNIVRGRALVFERWQRVATSDTRAYAGSRRRREKITSEAVRLPDLGDIVNEAIDAELKQQFNDVRALVNHDPDKYLGSMFNRSLKLTKTADALEFELRVPMTSNGNDLLAILQNEGGIIPMSVGFVSKGKRSNTKEINFDDKALEQDIENNTDKSKQLDNTPINLQEGRLDGSDYVAGRNVKNGRDGIVYRSFDLREISFLIGQEPAWEGTYGKLGSAEPTSQEQARARELAMVELRC